MSTAEGWDEDTYKDVIEDEILDRLWWEDRKAKILEDGTLIASRQFQDGWEAVVRMAFGMRG